MDKETMMKVLKDCRLKVENIELLDSPTVTTCVICPSLGAKVASFRNKVMDVSLALGRSVRFNCNGNDLEYEVAKDRTERRQVSLSEMVDCPEWESAKTEMNLPVPLGIDSHGKRRYADLAKMQHLLIGGATKQGKSEFIRCIITSLSAVRSREELLFRILDDKMCEFMDYEADHKVVYGDDCISEVKLINEEIDLRYSEIHKNPKIKFPNIVAVIDEYSEFLYAKECHDIKKDVLRIAVDGPKVGIHLIIATQRVERDVVSALLKVNIPTSIAFRVLTSQESRLLINTSGAEYLTGSGDMLFNNGTEIIRIQSPIDKS